MTSKKKDTVLDEYVKMIQSLKREYQTVYTEKNKLKDFLRKREKDRKREEQEFSKKTTCQTNGYLQQNDCSTKKRQNIKRIIMKVIAAIMMQKALKITTAVTKNENRDPPKKLT